VCVVDLTPDAVAVPASGATTTLAASVPPGCDVRLASDQTWATPGPDVPRAGDGVRMTIATAANSTASARVATLTVTTKDAVAKLAVRQPGVVTDLPCPKLKLNRTADQAGSSAQDKHFVAVEAPTAECVWDVVSDPNAPWIVVTAASRRGSGQVEYTLQPNDDATERSAIIKIGAESFVVTQSGRDSSTTDTGGGSGDGGGDGSGGDGSGSGGGDA